MITKDDKSNQTLVDLNIDTLSRKRGSYLFLIVMAIVILIYIIALGATPHAFQNMHGPEKCNYNATEYFEDGVCEYFDISKAQKEQYTLDNEDPLNLEHAANITYKAYVGDVHKRNYAISMEITAIRSHDVTTYEAFAQQASYTFTLLHRDIKTNVVSEIYKNKHEKVTMYCNAVEDLSRENHCETKNILHFNEIKGGDYEILFEFIDIPGWRGLIEAFRFEGSMYNLKFINYMLGVRYFFTIISVIFLVCFYKNTYSHRTANRSFEQKYIFWLSCLLPFSNDILAVVNILYPNMITILISCAVTGVFVAYVIQFWLVMIKRIAGEQNSTSTTQLTVWTKLFVFIIFAINLCAVMMINYEYIDDPAYSQVENHPDGYRGLMFLLSVTYIMLAFEIFCGLWAISKVWKSRLSRHKTFILFSLYFMIAFIIINATGFGHYYQRSGAGILTSVALYNLYIFCLQYLYMFSSTGKEKESRFKEVNEAYVENAQFAYMDKLEDNDQEDNKTDEGDEALGNDDIVDFEFGNNNPNFMNQGDINPDKVLKFTNNRTNSETETYKPANLQKQVSINPLEKQISVNSVQQKSTIKSDEIGEFDGLHNSDFVNPEDLNNQKSIQFVIDDDELQDKPENDQSNEGNFFELKAGEKFEFVDDKFDDPSKDYEVFYEDEKS